MCRPEALLGGAQPTTEAGRGPTSTSLSAARHAVKRAFKQLHAASMEGKAGQSALAGPDADAEAALIGPSSKRDRLAGFVADSAASC